MYTSRDFKIIKGSNLKFDIIGDIHGCYHELIELVEKLGYKKGKNHYYHPKGRILVSVGDICDKGYENLKCLDFWLNQVTYGSGYWVYGNHCNKFFRFLLGNKVKLTHGLENTAREYYALEEEERFAFKKRYMSVYRRQAYYLLADKGRLLIVHGGMKKEYIGHFNHKIKTLCIYGDVTGEFEESGKPIRKDWAQEYDGYTFIVYGHTVKKEAKIVNRTIDIDQGCVYGGYLTAFRYPEKQIVQVKGKAYAPYSGPIVFEEKMEEKETEKGQQ